VALGAGGDELLALCIPAMSESDNAIFQIAACWTLPLANAAGAAPG
jgi:hypothetical protein